MRYHTGTLTLAHEISSIAVRFSRPTTRPFEVEDGHCCVAPVPLVAAWMRMPELVQQDRYIDS